MYLLAFKFPLIKHETHFDINLLKLLEFKRDLDNFKADLDEASDGIGIKSSLRN